MGTPREKGKVGRMQATIAGLFVYPVKGCGGIALESARLLERGIEHDRRWMVVTPEGRFLTQRELPALARVRPWPGPDGGLRLSMPDGVAAIDVPPGDAGLPLRVRVWRDEVDALAPSPEADEALAKYFGRPVRLVRFPDAARRVCDPEHAPPGSHTGFADGYPLLVTSEASLDEVNAAILERGGEAVPMDRFRPNVVLAGVPARAEDRAAAVRLADGTLLLLVKPCDRCVVTTTDQATGERNGPEPVATLRRIRRNPLTGGMTFGQNAVPVLSLGGSTTLRLGEGCDLTPA